MLTADVLSTTSSVATSTLLGKFQVSTSTAQGDVISVQDSGTLNPFQFYDTSGRPLLVLTSGGFLTFPADPSATVRRISTGNQTVANTAASALQLLGGNGSGSGAGGGFTMTAGTGGSTANGGALTFLGGAGGTGGAAQNGGQITLTGGRGRNGGSGGAVGIYGGQGNETGSVSGNVYVFGGTGLQGVGGAVNGANAIISGGTGSDDGSATATNGGNVILVATTSTNGGTKGSVMVQNSAGINGVLNMESLASSAKTFTFPNSTGTVCLFGVNCGPSIGATTTAPFMATYYIATSSGTVTVPAFTFTDGAGMYHIGANSLGLTNGVSGLTWDGTMWAPNTTAVRDLGGSSNVWKKLYANFASTTALNATNLFATSATTTNFGITGVSSAMLLAGATGGITGYVPPTGCSNQFLTAITATGGFTCASVADAAFSGTLGIAHGGTNASLSGANQVLFMNSANTAVAASTSLVFTASNNFGISSSTPWAALTVIGNPNNGPLFIVATSTTGNASSTEAVFMIDQNEHIIQGGGLPTLAACGTGATVIGNDNTMVITTGSTGITECTITFARSWAPYPAPVCSFDEQGSLASVTLVGSTSQTTLRLGLSASLTSARIGVMCESYYQ